MKYIFLIILVAFLACLTLKINNILKEDSPHFRYHVEMLNDGRYNNQYWQTVKQKLNVKIENGHIQEMHF
jgi:hypothetical protein